MSVYFTSDLHIGHQRVAEFRGMTVEDHDNLILGNWEALVQPDDEVWVLGDISAGGKAAQLNALERLKELPGRKHLIAGNHDGPHPCNYRDSHKWQRIYLDTFESVQLFARRRISGRYVLLSHFPCYGDHADQPRYEQFRLRCMGVLLLHGHIHRPVRKSGHQIHVGLDAWDFKPVHLDQIAELIPKAECFGSHTAGGVNIRLGEFVAQHQREYSVLGGFDCCTCGWTVHDGSGCATYEEHVEAAWHTATTP